MSSIDKNSVRAWGIAQRAALSSADRLQASQVIADSLRDWLTFQQQLPQLLLYRGVRDEVDTGLLFSPPAVEELYAPRVAGIDLAWLRVYPDSVWCRGSFGVPEPQSEEHWHPVEGRPTVVVCPLTAFDRTGGRVGMGMGYFDRWLAEYGSYLSAVIGLAFACQEYGSVPTDSHDQPLQWVITEKERIACH